MNYFYPKREEILALHYAVIEKTGGTHGVRDMNLFLSLCDKPRATFGKKPLYPDIYTQAAVYLEGFAKYHVFIDGNKRTAFATAKRFLYINEIILKPRNSEVVTFMVKAVEGKLSVEEIATWIRKESE